MRTSVHVQVPAATSSAWQDAPPRRWPSVVALLALVAVLPAAGWAISRYAGLPRLPERLPGWAEVLAMLQGSELPVGLVAHLALWVFWLVWAWLVLSLAVELLLAAADLATHGAAWVHLLRAGAGHVTAPLARRVVNGALVATVVVQLASRAAPAAAASLPEPAVATSPAAPQEARLAPAPGRPLAGEDGAAAPETAPERAASTTYEVQKGDTLWGIAERFLGSGYDFPFIVEANAGRVMQDGTTFQRTGLIRAGWTLAVPRPNVAVQEHDGARFYVVQPGDTLEGIAGRVLGDPQAWPTLFERNRGVARLPDGRTLTYPSLIWPGLRLQLPQDVRERPRIQDVPAAEAGTSAPAPVGVPDPEPTDDRPGEGSEVAPVQVPAAAVAPAMAPPELPGLVEDAGVDAAAMAAPVTPTPEGPAAAEVADDASIGARGATPPAPGAGPPLPEVPRVPAVPLALGAAGVAATAAAGSVAIGLLRRRIRRSADEPRVVPDGEVALTGGYAAADFGRVLAHRAYVGEEVEPAVLGAEQALRFFTAHGSAAPDVVMVLQEQTARGIALTLTVRAAPEQRHLLLELAPALGRCLGGTGRGSLTLDHEVELALRDLKRSQLEHPALTSLTEVPTAAPEGAPAPAMPSLSPVLLPLGAQSSRAIAYGNWHELGHVLVASQPGTGETGAAAAPTVLASLVAALAARGHPDQLHLWTIARREALPGLVGELPHQRDGLIAPDEGERVAAALEEVRDELRRRMEWVQQAQAGATAAAGAGLTAGPGAGPQTDQAVLPELVVVLAELADFAAGTPLAGDLAALLADVGRDGPAYGIRLLAATTQPATLDDAVVAHFVTRLALTLPDAATSIRLLGWPDAAALGGGGDLLACIGPRRPVRLRGFRLGTEHLAELVRLMREVYGVEATPPPPPPPPPAPPFPTPGQLAPDPPGRSRSRQTTSPVATAAPEERGTGATAPVAASAPVAFTPPPSRGTPVARSSSPEPPAPSAAHSHTLAGDLEEAQAERAVAAQPTPGTPAAPGAAAPGPRLEVRCLVERMEVRYQGRALSPVARGRSEHQAWELLAVLAAQPTGVLAKDTLRQLFWPEEDPQLTSRRLNTTLWRLRTVLTQQVPDLPETFLQHDRSGVYRLDGAVVASDAQAFAELCARARRVLGPRPAGAADDTTATEVMALYEQAVALYQADLLKGHDYDWLHDHAEGVSLQEQYRDWYREATDALGRHYERRGQWERAARLHRQVLAGEPTAEDAARALFRCYGQLGDLTGLERAHWRLVQALATAADGDPALSAPERETEAVYQAVRAALGRVAPSGGGDLSGDVQAAGD